MKHCSLSRDSDTASTVCLQFSKGLKEGHGASKRWNYFNQSSSYVRHKDGILQTAYSVDFRKGAGFTGSIIISFFSSAHQCFNSYGSGIKSLNLPIYDVSEDNDVAIMTQPLDFTARIGRIPLELFDVWICEVTVVYIFNLIFIVRRSWIFL